MVTITIDGSMTEAGKLEFELPSDLPDDEFELIIKVSREKLAVTALDDAAPLTDEEIEELIQLTPKPLGEIETRGWEDMGIEDSVEWVEEQRRKQREERQQRWMDC